MRQRIEPIDVENALVTDLTTLAESGGLTFSVLAPPVPSTIAANTACVTRTGGGRVSLVIDQPLVSVDVWAETWEKATGLADEACGLVAMLPFAEGTATRWLEPEGGVVVTLPYANPDPLHPTLPRCTFLARLGVRANVVTF